MCTLLSLVVKCTHYMYMYDRELVTAIQIGCLYACALPITKSCNWLVTCVVSLYKVNEHTLHSMHIHRTCTEHWFAWYTVFLCEHQLNCCEPV